MAKYIVLALGILDISTGFVFAGTALTAGAAVWIVASKIDRSVTAR